MRFILLLSLFFMLLNKTYAFSGFLIETPTVVKRLVKPCSIKNDLLSVSSRIFSTSSSQGGRSLNINTDLAKSLVNEQFPQWRNLFIKPVSHSGWDNRTFHLGEDMLIRMPSSKAYEPQVEKEQRFLPRIAQYLSIKIPTPIAMGAPSSAYPLKWSIYNWIEGVSAAHITIRDLPLFAKQVATFLNELQRAPITDVPDAGSHNFFRGGNLSTYSSQTNEALKLLEGKIDIIKATRIWERSLSTTWGKKPILVHGDVSTGNLLLKNGNLNAVIDFGLLAKGDPACDLVLAWTFFDKDARTQFKESLTEIDENTWHRAKGWALWKASIVASEMVKTNAVEKLQTTKTLEEVIDDG